MIKRAALVLTTLALIAGCGSESEEGGGDELAALAEAARKSADTESYRFDATIDSDVGSETMKLDASGTSAADSSKGTMKGTMDFGDGAMEFEAIMSDGQMYMASEDLGLPAGKWLHTEDQPTQTLSPSEFVAFLRDSGDVELVGTEEVQGEQAQHFRGPLDMKELIDKSGDSPFIQQMKQTPGVEDLDVVVDIWVPANGLPSRLAVDMKMPGQDGTMKMASEILEYDVPINADPPPDDDVVDSPGG
jgi:hypothetical protein